MFSGKFQWYIHTQKHINVQIYCRACAGHPISLRLYSLYCSQYFQGYTLPKKPPSLFWWADAQFLHNQDNTLVMSVTAYEDRGSGWTPLVVTRQVEGLTYTMNFDNKICKCRTQFTYFRLLDRAVSQSW